MPLHPKSVGGRCREFANNSRDEKREYFQRQSINGKRRNEIFSTFLRIILLLFLAFKCGNEQFRI